MESFQKYLELVLPKTEFNQLSAYLIEKKIKKGEIILNAGSICNHSFFVEEGLLRSYSIDEQGKEHIIQFAPENWMISDRSSLLFQEPSEFYIDAVENTILIMFEEEFVNKASEVSAKFKLVFASAPIKK